MMVDDDDDDDDDDDFEWLMFLGELDGMIFCDLFALNRLFDKSKPGNGWGCQSIYCIALAIVQIARLIAHKFAPHLAN